MKRKATVPRRGGAWGGTRLLAAVAAFLLAGCAGTLAAGGPTAPSCDADEIRGHGIPIFSPTVQKVCYTLFAGTDHQVRCESANARPGSVMTPATAHTVCADATGRVTFLQPSTPGFGAVITSLAGPAGDLVSHVMVVP